MISRRLFASCAAVFTAGCALVLVPSAAASAHPLGNFTVNRYDGLVAAPGQLRVDHVEDLAEIPATQAKPDIERLGMDAWARERCATAAAGSRLTVDGRGVPLTAGASKAVVRPGQAGLDTLRVECRLTAPLPDGSTVAVAFHSEGASTGPGWREITARGDRMTLADSDVPEKSVSHELTTYPKELLSSPADTATAAVTVRPGGAALVEEGRDAPAASVLPRGADRWTRALDDLVARQDLTVGFAALALVIAVVLGAMHAVAPGHGKTIMAATAAARGGKARMKDVLPLAASVTVTHTLGVVALGLLVTAGSAAAPSVIAWLGLASGALVLFAGATLARRAWRGRGPDAPRGHDHGHDHDHPHPHPHPHGDGHGHGHGHDHPHPHEPAKAPERQLALVGATTPHTHAHHDADHGHGHDHGHAQEHEHGHDHARPHDHGRPHTHGGHTHSHGGRTHTHAVAPTLRGTLLLGFAGGMVPSPSAVVVLVGAAALGHAWFGLLLVVAYGVGLALTLTAAGFAVVRLGAGATRLLERQPRWSHPAVTLVRRNMPLWSAFLVVALGAGLVLRGAASVLG
ncbi:nickel/cobalt exporter [Streptomyces sp. B4I13]|uniref:HoxN/HupN/NixA family nickel/cobalt transporter n=1 Tax=Streptomyces sp. B4I13 TaxID=3042271 RepID=UPI00277D9BB3|nr:nickel transporter [Streptomyces sp. B4I13]MDQ0962891.1 nickel/cobalt exporter [Streptomyces sp. B4I13]